MNRKSPSSRRRAERWTKQPHTGRRPARRRASPTQAEQPVQARHPVPTVGHQGVALEALVERDALPLQPAEPVLADELPVGQHSRAAIRVAPKTLRKRSIRAMRSAVSEFPALSRRLQKTGTAIALVGWMRFAYPPYVTDLASLTSTEPSAASGILCRLP
ncbi:hypothetical protein [Methylomagnum sp.]